MQTARRRITTALVALAAAGSACVFAAGPAPNEWGDQMISEFMRDVAQSA